MSWTDVYPVFDEDKIAEYHESATAAEKEQLEHWYGIERIINPKPEQTEIISVSLFWKNVRAGDPELPTPTLNILKTPSISGMQSASTPGITTFFPSSNSPLASSKRIPTQPSASISLMISNS